MMHAASMVAVLSGGLVVACMQLAGLAITRVLAVFAFIFLMASVRRHVFLFLLHSCIGSAYIGHGGSFQATGPGPQGITTEVLRDSDEG